MCEMDMTVPTLQSWKRSTSFRAWHFVGTTSLCTCLSKDPTHDPQMELLAQPGPKAGCVSVNSLSSPIVAAVRHLPPTPMEGS